MSVNVDASGFAKVNKDEVKSGIVRTSKKFTRFYLSDRNKGLLSKASLIRTNSGITIHITVKGSMILKIGEKEE